MTLTQQWNVVELQMRESDIPAHYIEQFKSIYFMGAHATLLHARKGGDLFDYSLEVDAFVKTEVLHDE